MKCNNKGVFISGQPSAQTPSLLLSSLETHLNLNPSEEDKPFKDAPIILLATYASEVGLLLSAELTYITWGEKKMFPSVASYPFSRDAERGVELIIDSFAAGCTCLYFFTL